MISGAVTRLARTGLRRGVRQGSRPWLVIGMTATALRLVRRFAARQEETVFRAELKPGAGVEIRALEPEPRGRRARRARRAAAARGR